MQIMHFAGDPRAHGKPANERDWAAVIGAPAEIVKAQATGKNPRVGIAFFGPSKNKPDQLVAHVADLGSVTNFGRVNQRIVSDLRAKDEPVTYLTAGAAIGEGDLMLSLVHFGDDGKVAAFTGQEQFDPVTLEDMGRGHADIPIVVSSDIR
jgi:hypothetical protein